MTAFGFGSEIASRPAGPQPSTVCGPGAGGRPGDATSAASGIQLVVQALPFTVNAVGAALLALHVPWKPNVVDMPAATFPL